MSDWIEDLLKRKELMLGMENLAKTPWLEVTDSRGESTTTIC